MGRKKEKGGEIHEEIASGAFIRPWLIREWFADFSPAHQFAVKKWSWSCLILTKGSGLALLIFCLLSWDKLSWAWMETGCLTNDTLPCSAVAAVDFFLK